MPAPGADVAIVGAGLAGLTAARRLSEAEVSIVVLEARGRVGGRMLSEPIGDGKVIDVGGQWIGPTQDRMYALAREAGISTFPTHTTGHNLLELGGRLRRYSGTIPRLGPLVLLDIARAQRKLNRLARAGRRLGAREGRRPRAERAARDRRGAAEPRGPDRVRATVAAES